MNLWKSLLFFMALIVVSYATISLTPKVSGQGGQRAWQGTVGTPNDFLTEVAKGVVPGHSIIHVFGRATVGTTLVPICPSLTYQVPTTAQALEFVSSDADDTAAGTGAREITITGLDENWLLTEQTLATNGTTAVDLTTDLIRLLSWEVTQSGSYATQAVGSHAGVLTIRADGAGATWSTIGITPFPIGKSQIGAYTIPLGYRGYVFIQEIQVEATKVVDALFFKRRRANDITAPFGAMTADADFIGISGRINPNTNAPQNGFNAVLQTADIGYMAKVASGTSDIAVTYEVLLVKVGY